MKKTREENGRRINDFGSRNKMNVLKKSTKSTKLTWQEPKKSTNNLQ